MSQARILLIGLFFSLFSYSSGLYFHIGETERKCFIEEIPDETMVTGNSLDRKKMYFSDSVCCNCTFQNFDFFRHLNSNFKQA